MFYSDFIELILHRTLEGNDLDVRSLVCLNLEFFIFSYSKSSSILDSLFPWGF